MTKEEAIEIAKNHIWNSDAWMNIIQVWPTEDENKGGHSSNENCACKPRVEIQDGVFRVIHHNILYH